MADWKDTCNLPRTAFSMKANLQTTEPEASPAGTRWTCTADSGGAQGRAEVPAARRPAVRQRRHPHRHALNKILKDLVVKSHNMLGFDAPVHAGLGLPRPADRAEGRSRARPEEARDERRRLPPRLPGLRREVRRHPARGLQAARRARRLGRSVPDDERSDTRRRSCARSASSSSRTWSTRARSRCTGARIAAPRWPKPRSNTSRTPRRRSTSSSR